MMGRNPAINDCPNLVYHLKVALCEWRAAIVIADAVVTLKIILVSPIKVIAMFIIIDLIIILLGLPDCVPASPTIAHSTGQFCP